MKTRTLLFIPMYNCEKQITRVLGQLTDKVCQLLGEVVVINNRSTDHGEKAVMDYLDSHKMPIKVSLLRNDDNYGLGGSHKVAFQYAIENNFDYVITLHGDDQGDISNIVPYLQNGKAYQYDCFLGARFMKGAKLEGYSKFRTFGNRVYDMLFSIGCGRKIYDLGSGLNMYRVEILKNHFYFRYKDNLMFNYCMILGSSYYQHHDQFFPIIWREDDQVSNVKMVNQAITVLKILGSYIVNKKKFVDGEHRDKIVKDYTAQRIYTNME